MKVLTNPQTGAHSIICDAPGELAPVTDAEIARVLVAAGIPATTLDGFSEVFTPSAPVPSIEDRFQPTADVDEVFRQRAQLALDVRAELQRETGMPYAREGSHTAVLIADWEASPTRQDRELLEATIESYGTPIDSVAELEKARTLDRTSDAKLQVDLARIDRETAERSKRFAESQAALRRRASFA